MGSEAYLAAVKARRTYYELEPKSTISDARIQEIVKETLFHTPSTFNSQSTRIVILLKADHVRLWNDIVKPAVKAVMPADFWPTTEEKLTGFQNSYGTVCLWLRVFYILFRAQFHELDPIVRGP